MTFILHKVFTGWLLSKLDFLKNGDINLVGPFTIVISVPTYFYIREAALLKYLDLSLATSC